MKTIVLTTLLFITLLLLTPTRTPVASGPHMLTHQTLGYSIDSVARVDNAAQLGVTTAVIYGKPFTPSDPVGAEMLAKGMHEVDGGLSSQLYYYECHRTHTVAFPPKGTPNVYCPNDLIPSLNSKAALLSAIDARLQADAHNPLIVGYWVLDDWALWDSGSAKTILQDIRTHIRHYTPFYPAICGFGVSVSTSNINLFLPSIAQNYSNAGCDMVGIYSYVNTYASPIASTKFDFTMKTGLTAAFAALKQQGWNIKNTPLIGIGQAFAGPYGKTRYQPGLTSAQMVTQAQAFLKAGAVSIGWYAWDDSGFGSQSATPMTSSQIQQGIKSSITACQSMWHKK